MKTATNVKKQFKVPQPIPQKDFNIGKQVFNYLIAHRLQGHFEQEGHPMQLHFGGLTQGYDDWFDALGINQDEFDTVRARAVDQKKLEEEIARLIPIFEEQWAKVVQKDDKKFQEFRNADPTKVKAMMEDFKSKLKER